MTCAVGALPEWLADQRWFAGHGRQFTVTGVEALPWLQTPAGPGHPGMRIELINVHFGDDDSHETYQVPLEYRAKPAEHLAHALVGECAQPTDGDGPAWVYDALQDKDVTGEWLTGMHAGRHTDGVSFHQEPAAGDFPTDAPSLMISSEQTNTSLVYGDAVILKVFRRLAAGLNPDVECHHALAEAGNAHVAPLLGWVDGRWTDPVSGELVEGTLAIAQRFLRSATVGWNLALTSVRDLYADPTHRPDQAGGDFASESFRLGQATASVHLDLARTMGTDTLRAEDLGEVARGMSRRLEPAIAAVPDLAPYADALATVYADLAVHDRPLPAQRIHGDLHLGQTMRVLGGWRIIDFEGEPARPLAERRMLHSPLKDVAGMLRSLDYAAHHLLAERGEVGLEDRAAEWVSRNRAAYLDGYAELADAGADPVALRAFELDKAVYEVVYEARHRPTWVSIPLSAIARLLG